MRITPLARPVVPDEYGSTAVSPAVVVSSGGVAVVASRSASEVTPSTASSVTTASSGSPASASAARARSRNGDTVTSSFAPESAS